MITQINICELIKKMIEKIYCRFCRTGILKFNYWDKLLICAECKTRYNKYVDIIEEGDPQRKLKVGIA